MVSRDDMQSSFGTQYIGWSPLDQAYESLAVLMFKVIGLSIEHFIFRLRHHTVNLMLDMAVMAVLTHRLFVITVALPTFPSPRAQQPDFLATEATIQYVFTTDDSFLDALATRVSAQPPLCC